ncbi:hypothetical protein Pfo_028433 [Paulownia fortunei]|nr:hypothetical protein Pfo_028433 [Paulownia fortunei]
MERFFPLLCFSLLAFFQPASPFHGAWALKTDSLTRELLESARDAEFLDWLKRVRRKIHEYPELAFEEQLTSQLIRSELDSLGIEYEWPVAETGLGALLGRGHSPGSVLEQTWMPSLFSGMGAKSKIDGKMHACGHDAHVTMLLGAAKLLQNNRDKLKGTVKLVFQPGEEGYAGAYYMPFFGLHVEPTMPTGTISSKPGPMLAGSARFSVIIQGKGDPIPVLSMVILALQHIVSRETDPLEPRVVSIGYVQGGQALNVIPETVKFGGTFRFMNSESYSYLKQRIKEVIETQAAVHQCTAVVDFMEGKLRPYPATINHPMMYEHAKRIGENLLGEHGVRLHSMTMGAEDFSFYSEKMPAAFFMIGARNETMTSVKGWHSPHFVIDEGVLPIGASLHAAVALSYLDGHAEIQ